MKIKYITLVLAALSAAIPWIEMGVLVLRRSEATTQHAKSTVTIKIRGQEPIEYVVQ